MAGLNVRRAFCQGSGFGEPWITRWRIWGAIKVPFGKLLVLGLFACVLGWFGGFEGGVDWGLEVLGDMGIRYGGVV